MALPYFQNKHLYTPDDNIIEKPAVLLDKTGVFLKYGDSKLIDLEFAKYINGFISINVKVPPLIAIRFEVPKTAKLFSPEDAAYIIRHMLEYTNPDFIKKFIDICMNTTNYTTSDISTWLDTEKANCPIDIYSK